MPTNEADDLFLEDDTERDPSTLFLPEPNPQAVEIKTLHNWYAKGHVDLEPYYQRDVVWNAARQSKIINSLFTNFYVPPVIFKAVITHEDGKKLKTFTAIDGKQRLSSIMNFFAGEIPYVDPDGQKYFYPTAGGVLDRRAKWLPPELILKFHEKPLLVIEYQGLTRQQEEELFARVQQGMPLSAAEKSQAGQGPWHRFIRAIMNRYEDVATICVDNTRGRPFGRVASAIVMLNARSDLADPMTPLGWRGTSQAVNNLVNSKTAPSEHFINRVLLVFSIFDSLLHQRPEVFTNELEVESMRRFAPVEFIAVVVLIDMYQRTRNNACLAEDILELRQVIRKRVDDLKTNGFCWNVFWNQLTAVPSNRSSQRPSPDTRLAPTWPAELLPGARVVNNDEQKLIPPEKLKGADKVLRKEFARKVLDLKKARDLAKAREKGATRNGHSAGSSKVKSEVKARRMGPRAAKHTPVAAAAAAPKPAMVELSSDDDELIDDVWVSSAPPPSRPSTLNGHAKVTTSVPDEQALRAEFEKEERFQEYKRSKEAEAATSASKKRRLG